MAIGGDEMLNCADIISCHKRAERAQSAPSRGQPSDRLDALADPLTCTERKAPAHLDHKQRRVVQHVLESGLNEETYVPNGATLR